MASLTDLVRARTRLTRDQILHLNRLASEWGMLADFCFSDLLLHVRTVDEQWMTVSQVRPATGQTIYEGDYVGVVVGTERRTLFDEVASTSLAAEADVPVAEVDEPVRVQAMPVCSGDQVIAVLTRETVHSSRRSGDLERTYLAIFDELVGMIAAGDFPFDSRVGDSSSAPRVGDGVMWLDDEAVVRYVSPNANSALHRVGIQSSALGMRLAELGFYDGPVRQAFERRVPVIEEFEQGLETTLLCRCVPLLSSGKVSGGVLLVRDVTELRKRDRLLLSKDATIREIHHRVKNNLQTISSLLRLQARRLVNPEAKAAVSESVRRIRTIALVHESLSREPGDDVTFIEIVRPLLRLAEEGLQSPDRPVRFEVRGDGGRVPAGIATPLSVVLTELLQNAVDHGFPEGSTGGGVVVWLEPRDRALRIRVVDDGRGLDPNFSLDEVNGLGLSIVRTLVTTELNGEIEMRPASADDLQSSGFEAIGTQRGTVVDLTVPTRLD